MTDTLKRLHIFLASPSDMASERAKVETVVAMLKPTADYLGLTLKVLDWRKAVPDMGRPQQVIFDQLKPMLWDVFIGILWHRFGTPSAAVDAARQKEYLSGTEEEFWTAYRLWKEFGRPRLMMYRCTRQVDLNAIDFDQAKRVKEFFAQFEPTGEHPGLAQSFDTLDAFEKLLLDHLQKLLLEYGEQSKTPITLEVAQILTPRIPNNLPRRAAFFGRRKEMDVVMRALSPTDRTWGVLVDGIGGIGKTALAIEAAHRTQDAGAFDAFVLVSAKQNVLTPTGIRELTPAAHTLNDFLNETALVLGQHGILKLSGDEKRRALLDALRSTRALLIFDNLETLSKEDQEALADFLRELPQGCKAIITSRWRGGEGAVWLRVEALDWDAARGIIENEMARDAQLANKLRRVESRWQELHDEMKGSPLALVHTLGLMRVRAALTFDGALGMLRGNRDPDLQRFVFQEARKELTTNDKTALGALSLFVPSATFEAWMQVANLSRNALETTIDRLSALSLVDVLAGEERYALHPLTRAFVRDELLADAAVESEMGMRFARYWVRYAALYGGSSSKYETFDRLEAEWTNLDVAANWLRETAHMQGDLLGDKDAARMIITETRAVERFLRFSSRWDEHQSWNQYAYEAACLLPEWSDAGWCARAVAWTLLYRGDLDRAELWAERCEEAWIRSGGTNERAIATKLRGTIAQQRKDYARAEQLFVKALQMRSDAKNAKGVAIMLTDLGELAHERRDYDAAEGYYRKGLKWALENGDKPRQASRLTNLAELAMDREQWTEARIQFEQALALAQEVGRRDEIARARCGLARVYEAEGRADLALPLAQEALEIYGRLQHKNLAEVRELVERLQKAV